MISDALAVATVIALAYAALAGCHLVLRRLKRRNTPKKTLTNKATGATARYRRINHNGRP